MVKYIFNVLVTFLMLSSFCFAKINDAYLQEEYGQDLTHAPFFLRFAFYKEYNKDWKKSDYDERKGFLTNYETSLAAEQKEEKAEAKAEADKENEHIRQKKEEQREEREKLRAQLAEEKAEKISDIDTQKEFDALVKEQKRELQQMQQEIQGNN